MSNGKLFADVCSKEVVMSEVRRRKRAVCFSAANGVVGRWFERNAWIQFGVGVSDLSAR